MACVLARCDLSALPQDSATYFGGVAAPPGGADVDRVVGRRGKGDAFQKRVMGKRKAGLHRLSGRFTLLGAFGLYYPTWQVAKRLAHDLATRQRLRAIDVEYAKRQGKNATFTHFWFPAIVSMHMADAKLGIHAEYLKRDYQKY